MLAGFASCVLQPAKEILKNNKAIRAADVRKKMPDLKIFLIFFPIVLP